MFLNYANNELVVRDVATGITLKSSVLRWFRDNGRRTRKREPAPISLSAAMVPPCISVIHRAIAKPKPAPRSSRERVESALTNEAEAAVEAVTVTVAVPLTAPLVACTVLLPVPVEGAV